MFGVRLKPPFCQVSDMLPVQRAAGFIVVQEVVGRSGLPQMLTTGPPAYAWNTCSPVQVVRMREERAAAIRQHGQVAQRQIHTALVVCRTVVGGRIDVLILRILPLPC
jgi:hypothetical protein